MAGRWALAGALLGAVAGVLLFAPAAWLAAGVAAATDSRVQLSDARGSVWRGSAHLLVSGGVASRDALALPTRVAWELEPVWAGARLQLRTGCCTPQPLQATLTAGWRRWTVRVQDGSSQWPAELLAGLGAPWNTLQPRGQLHLVSRGLSVEWVEGRLRLGGSAQLEAVNVSSSLSTLRPLGSYRLRVAGDGNQEAPGLLLETLEGALMLTGSGRWTGAGWSFRGEASATPESESALANLLNMVGRRQGAKSMLSLG